jgi:hypothetical protein
MSGSADAQIIRHRLAETFPDIACLTEIHHDFLSEWEGSSISGSDSWEGDTDGSCCDVSCCPMNLGATLM